MTTDTPDQTKSKKPLPPQFWHLDNAKRQPVPKWKLQLEQWRRRQTRGGK